MEDIDVSTIDDELLIDFIQKQQVSIFIINTRYLLKDLEQLKRLRRRLLTSYKNV